ncbi:MAG TPA: SMI1/KNR4 family protein [Gemmataceae bacterium]|jgi:hypothetical protein|nr:SMI1/KNR4 family protein [Gemmataceae bacterium]
MEKEVSARMKNRIYELSKRLTKRPGASLDVLNEVLSRLNVTPPQDYVEFMLESNGAEGPMGKDGYLMLFPAEQLEPCNKPYGLGPNGPGLVIFGSDGSTTYAFDIRDGHTGIVEVDSVSMDRGPIRLLGQSFQEFLETLSRPE